MIGAGLDWPAMSSLMLKASYLYVQNDGQATFSSQTQGAPYDMVGGPAGLGNPLNIGNFDDSKQQYFNLKAIYAYNKNWSFTAGYAYEKYNRTTSPLRATTTWRRSRRRAPSTPAQAT